MDNEVDFKKIQEKWIKRWKEEKLFQPKPEKGKKKFFLTVAFPYPSGSIHVGHARTYTVPDVIARYKRMQGYNVLFPMAWHVTGSPVIGVADRIKRKDAKTWKIYREVYQVPEKILKTFSEPENIVKYFSQSYQKNMTELGYSIDWSRQFFSITPQFSKFIEWQYKTLRKLGLIKKGEHPVRYCPHCQNPVGDHDLMEGETANINEFAVIKFYCNNLVLPAATLRPETIFGVTNMWLNPQVEYKKVKINQETWLLSEEAVEKIKFCKKDIEVIGKVKGKELVGKSCKDSVTGKEVPILPAEFVDPNYATGVVMSVPAHAPYDYIALKDLESDIKSVTIIDSPRGENPAQKIVKEMKIESQGDIKKLEKATEELYREEHSQGQMIKEIPDYGGMNVKEAREKLQQKLAQTEKGDVFYEFSQKPVICRCGTHCVIKILKDQWFVNYGDEEWKEKTHSCLKKMSIIPKEIQENFSYFIDWLKEWACTRRVGLGTKLPWDPKWIIEPLSDSTIYMAYYTLAPHLRELKAEKLKPEFFDYVLLGRGSPQKISQKTGIAKEKLHNIREEFTYWYPPQWRLSAKDLVGNHLTFHIFHHTALFPEKFWPQGIVVFGMGLLEGEKMSSSKGNVILLEDAIREYGSDVVRLFLMSNAEPWQDFNWQKSLVKSYEKKLKQFYKEVKGAFSSQAEHKEMREIDKWLLSRLHENIKKTNQSLQKFQTRKAIQFAFFNILNDLSWYKRRGKPNPSVLTPVANIWVRLMTPFTPFLCEELWEKKGFICNAPYPQGDPSLINPQANVKEGMLKTIIQDIQKILQATKVKPKKIYLYLSPKWKRKLFQKIKAEKSLSEIMKEVPSLKKHGKEASKTIKEVRPQEIPEVILTSDEEYATLSNAKEFLQKEFNCQVEIQKEIKYDPQSRAKFAMPMRAGIYLES